MRPVFRLASWVEARYELRRVQQGFALRQTDLGLDDLDDEFRAAQQARTLFQTETAHCFLSLARGRAV
jgi:hypothetical protein